MAFIKKPVTGMRDILPEETFLRNHLLAQIRETYAKYGFTEIETPIVEHMANLGGSEGGENEKLIFRILKRGDKLLTGLRTLAGGGDTSGVDKNINNISEEGLRYDLTVPLTRYYAANETRLPQPFKALQTGPVFRADRPQKGRFRQFTQCDIDILGDGTTLAEKELIIATSEAMMSIGFSRCGFYVVINDRRLLFELIAAAGLRSEDAFDILITLDKADKIGAEGVDAELISAGHPADAVGRLRALLTGFGTDASGARDFAGRIGSDAALAAGESVADIMETVTAALDIRIEFDPTLVRGMGYYTGTIFELRTEAFSSSIGGGGRYDGMVGRFLGRDIPAAGFSIGFERVMTILMQEGAAVSGSDREAWLIEKGIEGEKLREIFLLAAEERDKGRTVLMVRAAKNKKFQKERLSAEGYTDIREFFDR